ncbi:DUF4407 domain-containing protein [Actinokineospora sp. NPDC004072]
MAVVGGADPDDALDPHHKGRHVAVGVLMIAIALWAFLASLLAFRSNFQGPWVVSVIGALLLAAIVFAIDVIITVVPLKSESAWGRFKVIAIRGLLSIGVGVIVSHSTILFIYRNDLAAMVAQSNNTEVGRITREVQASSPWTPVIAQAEEQIEKDQKQIILLNASWMSVVRGR